MDRLFKMSAFVLIVSAVISVFGGIIFTEKAFNLSGVDYKDHTLIAQVAQGKSQLVNRFFSFAIVLLLFAVLVLQYYIIGKLSPESSKDEEIEEKAQNK